MKYSKEQIGKTILKERTRLGLSQAELGRKLGTVGKQISVYESGKIIPPIENLLKLCDIFNCELGYLLNEPDYSDHTRLETAILNTTGLTSESLAVIKRITGNAKPRLALICEPESYRSIFNSLITSNNFTNFIICLHDLDSVISDFKNVFPNIESQIGHTLLNEAVALYTSTIDYEHDTRITATLTPEQIEALNLLENGIDKQNNLTYAIKVARYELHEAFEALIEEMYPHEK